LESNKCSSLGIPDSLHKKDRLDIQDFDATEKIWRRFSPVDTFNKSNITEINGKRKPKLSVFPFKKNGMSCNRQKYSNVKEDVLYNIESSEHFWDWSIFELIHGNYDGIEIGEELIPITIHKSTECMYPHVEIWININGEPLVDIPEQHKLQLRKKFQELCEIVKDN